MDGHQILIIVLATLLAAEVGALIAYLSGNRKINELRASNIRLNTELEAERHAAQDREVAHLQARRQLTHTFNSLAGEALKNNSTEFIKLAQENLKQLHIRAEGTLAEREQAVRGLVKPIREALARTETEMRRMENERKEAQGALAQHLQGMVESQRELRGETRNLVQALRRPEIRGQWGEITLKRLAELAGMSEHCDFYQQETVDTEDGQIRPDMIVRMPGGRELIIDAKTPLDAYLTAVEASDDEAQEQALKRHARKVRERVRELSAKSYWEQFSHALEFVVLFIPGDQFLSAALEIDPQLLEDALNRKVVLATPSSLVALMRAVAYGWRQETLARNADRIRDVGQDLYARLSTFAEHLAQVGKNLDGSVHAFNKAVGSFDSRVMPGARKFTEMGIPECRPISGPVQVERSSRQVENRKTEESTT